MEKKKKERIDTLLVERGLVETRTRAQAMILAGYVLVNGHPVTKSGESVPLDAEVSIREQLPYVSRGGIKLASALDALGIAVRGMVCLDVGASTGGFTDCLLQRGAVKVYAVDVGHNQLHNKLLQDPRVVNMEGVNFRYFSAESLKEKIQFVTIDVSFISLEKILPAVAGCIGENGEVLAMVKPQFEADPGSTKRGVVVDESVRTAAIDKVRQCAVSLGFDIAGAADSALRGPQGNLEHFLWLKKKR